jgi:transposase-like protein
LLGYRTSACRSCHRVFNERTGTPFNELQCPTDIVLLAVLWRLRYKLSFRDVAEMLLQRGFEVTHETIREWEFRFAPLLADQLRTRRRGRASESWYLDETYVKVSGRWCYLYRAIDRDGELLDSMLSEHRDKHAVRRFLRRLVEVAGHKPLRVTTDKHPTYRKAIRWIIGRKAWHRTTQYLNNYTEQSHRAVKQCYYPMLGFGSFESASRFCAAFDELRQYFRVRRRGESHVSLAAQRRFFLARWRSLIAELAAV